MGRKRCGHGQLAHSPLQESGIAFAVGGGIHAGICRSEAHQPGLSHLRRESLHDHGGQVPHHHVG